jgi:hypothetical protein
MIGLDVLLQERPRRRLPVDVDLLDVDACSVQITSGIPAGRSGGLPVEKGFRHGGKIIHLVVGRFGNRVMAIW